MPSAFKRSTACFQVRAVRLALRRRAAELGGRRVGRARGQAAGGRLGVESDDGFRLGQLPAGGRHLGRRFASRLVGCMFVDRSAGRRSFGGAGRAAVIARRVVRQQGFLREPVAFAGPALRSLGGAGCRRRATGSAGITTEFREGIGVLHARAGRVRRDGGIGRGVALRIRDAHRRQQIRIASAGIRFVGGEFQIIARSGSFARRELGHPQDGQQRHDDQRNEDQTRSERSAQW